MREVSPPGRYFGWLTRDTMADFAIARYPADLMGIRT